MTTTTERATTVPSSPPSTPRVCLAPVRASQAVLDGGWWPRSADPVAELPGLLLALGEQYGPVRSVLLNNRAWDSRPRRLAVGTRVVRLGWFTSVDATLAIAITDRGDQLDLLIVPPDTAQAQARAAMARAADPTNVTRAADIFAAIAPEPVPARTAAVESDSNAGSAWDNEGGYQAESRPHRTAIVGSLS